MLQNQIPVRRWKQWLALPVLGGVFLATACQSASDQPLPSTAKQSAAAATEELAPPPPPKLTTVPSTAPDEASATKIYTYAEQMPQLPGGGGTSAIVQQIQAGVVWPAGLHQEGKVFASFTVNANGSVGDAKIVKGIAPAYDAAVIAAIEKLPHFVPGRQAGRAVMVSFTVPVLFKENP